MLKSGSEHLESLKDGRVVYIGSERVDDVTTHPAFRNGARSMAAIYDLKRANPAFSFTEGKEKYSAYFLRARIASMCTKTRSQGTFTFSHITIESVSSKRQVSGFSNSQGA